MENRSSKIAVIIAAIAFCLSAAALVIVIRGSNKPEEAPAKDIQYVLYLGTNDCDTNEPVYSPEEAKAVLKDILISRLGGYTIQEANGGWIDDDGTEYQEYTLVIYLSDTNENDVHALCDELIKKYHQSSVLIQKNETTTEFYSG